MKITVLNKHTQHVQNIKYETDGIAIGGPKIYGWNGSGTADPQQSEC